MARYSATLRDEQIDRFGRIFPGNVIGGGQVLVVSSSTGLNAVLTDDAGEPITNPLITNTDGTYYFNAPDGAYDQLFSKDGRLVGRKYQTPVGNIIPGSAIVNSLGNDPTKAIGQQATTAAIQNNTAAIALKYDASNPAAYVNGAGAKSASVGSDSTQAPSRSVLLSTTTGTVGGVNVGHIASYADPSDGLRKPYQNALSRNLFLNTSDWQVVTPEDFGAVGDALGMPGQFTSTRGVNPNPTDDTAALLAMFANVGPRTRVRLSKVYAFKQSLVMPLVNYVTIEGINEYTCGFLYNGAATNIDLMAVGDGSVEIIGWTFKKFIFDSSTKMTAGAALHTTRAIFFDYDNLVFQGQYAPLQPVAPVTTAACKLYNGLFTQGFLYSHIFKPDIFLSNFGMMCCGFAIPGLTTGYGANLIVYGGKKIGGCNTNILIGGGCNEVMFDEVDVIGGLVNNVRISQELYPYGNGGFFAKQCTFDSIQNTGAAADNILIDTANTDGTGFFLKFDGTWVATSFNGAHGIHIKNAGNSLFNRVQINGGYIGNISGDAIRVDTAFPMVDIMNTAIQVCNGTGINASNAGGANGSYRNVRAKNITFLGVNQDYSGNIEGLMCDWTPTFGTDSGSLPTQPTLAYAKFIDVGPLSSDVQLGSTHSPRIIHFEVRFTMPSNIGTASGQLYFTVPYSAQGAVNGSNVSSLSVQGIGNTTLGPLYGILSGIACRVLPTSGASTAKANEDMLVTGWYFAVGDGH